MTAAFISNGRHHTEDDRPSRPPLEILTAGELITDYPRLRSPVIDGIARQGEIVNVISKSKIGKSWFGYTTEGKRLRKTIYGKARRDVVDQLTRLQSQRLAGTLSVREKMTVAELIDRWLKSWSGNLAPGSRARYQQMAALYIKPALGGMDVTKLRPVHIRSLIDKLAEDGKGDRTRQYVFATLRRPMNLAVKMELIPRNPCDAVQAPHCKSKAVKPPTAEQVAALAAAASGSPWEAVFVLALTTGLRQGELFALAWEDIDFERRTLSVRHSLEELNGFLRIKEPKSASGRRTVKLPQPAVDALHAHRRILMAQGKAGSPWFHR